MTSEEFEIYEIGGECPECGTPVGEPFVDKNGRSWNTEYCAHCGANLLGVSDDEGRERMLPAL